MCAIIYFKLAASLADIIMLIICHIQKEFVDWMSILSLLPVLLEGDLLVDNGKLLTPTIDSGFPVLRSVSCYSNRVISIVDCFSRYNGDALATKSRFIFYGFTAWGQ